MAYRVRGMIKIQYDTFPLILQENLYYYIKFICSETHANCQIIFPKLVTRATRKTDPASGSSATDYSELSNIISASVGFELQKALSLKDLPNKNHESLNEVIAP